MPDTEPKTDPYFYCRQLPAAGDAVIITGDEARHMAAVRRLKAGHRLWLFDGGGRVAEGKLQEIKPRGQVVTVEIVKVETMPQPQPAITLACALPKSERLRVLLDMATQLGISEFVPLICARSKPKITDHSRQRWHRICLEGCKQSRRAYLPVIQDASSVDQLLAAATKETATVIMADPAGHALHGSRIPKNSQKYYLFIGPEGGFSDYEQQVFSQVRALSLSLGNGILRIETAAVALLAQMQLLTH